MILRYVQRLVIERPSRSNRSHDLQTIRDELFGFLVAGHDTTSTTLCWGVKFLTQHQEVSTSDITISYA
jgi:cytochrome P450